MNSSTESGCEMDIYEKYIVAQTKGDIIQGIQRLGVQKQIAHAIIQNQGMTEKEIEEKIQQKAGVK